MGNRHYVSKPNTYRLNGDASLGRQNTAFKQIAPTVYDCSSKRYSIFKHAQFDSKQFSH